MRCHLQYEGQPLARPSKEGTGSPERPAFLLDLCLTLGVMTGMSDQMYAVLQCL